MDLPFELHYEAPANCPTEVAFRAEVASRLPPTSTRRDPRRFSVSVRSEAGMYAGHLEVQGEGGASSRDAREATCVDLTRSLSLIIAIAADPLPTVAPSVAVPNPAPVASGAPRRSPVTIPPVPPARSARPASGPARAPFEWTAGAALGVGLTDRAFSGVRVHGQLAYRGAGWPLAPALRISGGYRERMVPVGTGAAARFRYRTARAEACLAPSATWKLTPAFCPALELGTLTARASGLPAADGGSTSWYAVGAVARLSIAGGLTRFELQLGAWMPLRRTEFLVLGPERRVYQPPVALLDAQAGLSVAAAFP